jgi:hypothetical protein
MVELSRGGEKFHETLTDGIRVRPYGFGGKYELSWAVRRDRVSRPRPNPGVAGTRHRPDQITLAAAPPGA